MTKIETRELANIELYIKANMTDTAARALSALHRAARTTKSKTAIFAIAQNYGITSHVDFII